MLLCLYSFFVPLVSIARSQRARTARQLSTTGWSLVLDHFKMLQGPDIGIVDTNADGGLALFAKHRNCADYDGLACPFFPPLHLTVFLFLFHMLCGGTGMAPSFDPTPLLALLEADRVAIEAGGDVPLCRLITRHSSIAFTVEPLGTTFR